MSTIDWQPDLSGETLRLRALKESDFEVLFNAASDPLIWELHPDRERYTRERFQVYFQSGIDSQGALLITDKWSGKIIGSSRFTEYRESTSSVEIGFTFLTRNYWGGDHNRELKTLMLGYAFQHVKNVYFAVGNDNFRSQRAMEKIGGTRVPNTGIIPISRDLSQSVVFLIKKETGPRKE